MYEIDFTHPGKIHFIGIGGISMSGFAELLHSMGFTITGSDWHESKITKHLESLGIQVVYGQKEENITKDIDLVVYTAAVKKTNPEYQAAEKLNLPLMERAVMVGQVMKNYSSAIAIAGTHGKTTTTSIASHIFLAANLDPTISVGGILEAIGGNIRIGHSKHFITEACEYTNSFLHFFPTVGMILNIEEDHMDFFHDLSDIRHSFHLFAKRIPEHGTLIINADIENYEEITEGLSCRVITYGLENKDADFTAENITYNDLGCGTFDAVVQGEVKGHFHLSVVGRHNVSNTLACLALASLYGIDDGTVQKALTTFHGADRRFEYKGEKNGFTIIDDYAHHPTEIRATLTAAKNYPHKTLWCAFQPHTYTRTRAFLKDFASALSLADKVILADIYAAREKDPGDISSADLARELEKLGKEVHYLRSFDEIEKFILKNLVNGDLLITMGSCSICPSSIKITRLPISLTNSLLCVTTKTVVPLLLISERSSMIPLAVTGSRFPVGSSASNNTGWFTKALAMATLCCSPPDNSFGKAFMRSFSPTISSIFST